MLKKLEEIGGERVLVDSDILIDYLRGKKESKELIIYLLENSKCYLTPINIAEIYSGKDLSDPQKEFIIDNFLKNFNLILLDKEISKTAGSLRRKYNLPLADAFIGAVSLIYNLILITRNIKDFHKIIGLKIFIPY
jgi:predicted nucleic acid-binding protein